MAEIHNEFDRYTLYYLTRHPGGIEAEIDCFLGEKRAGIIYFLKDAATLPDNALTVNGIYLYYHLSRFNDVMMTLREEKPLHLVFDKANKLGYVGTNWEPVGDLEP